MKYIRIEDKEVMVRPSALTPLLFKRMTNKDLLVFLQDKSVSHGDKIEGLFKLFYIMKIQAEIKDIKEEFKEAENIDAYYSFLDSFESKTLFSEEVLSQIVEVYTATNIQTSVAKN